MPQPDEQDQAEQLDETVQGGADDANYVAPHESMGADRLAGNDGGAHRSLAERDADQRPERGEEGIEQGIEMIDESSSDPSATTVGETGELDDADILSPEESAMHRGAD